MEARGESPTRSVKCELELITEPRGGGAEFTFTALTQGSVMLLTLFKMHLGVSGVYLFLNGQTGN